MKILIAVDGSEYTRRMLDHFAAHPEWLRAENRLTVVTVTPSVPPGAAALLDASVVDGFHHDEAEAVLQPVREFFRERGVEVEAKYKVGHAAEAIAEEATAGGYDLLVMGTRGHGALGSLVMGSVSTKVLGRCDTPVLLVR